MADGGDHPAVAVSWEDAAAFCIWLTGWERDAGSIAPGDVYRLPSDHEWSCAVGIGGREDASLPPAAHPSHSGVYPWGERFPPPPQAGNYRGEGEAAGGIIGYRDGYPQTAPVGSFAPNPYGLFDLGGNVSEWCRDWFDAARENRVLRGGSWYHEEEIHLRSAHRFASPPVFASEDAGFRVVLELGGG